MHAGVHETFGLVILEALACGRPVVAMRAGAVPELFDERAGCLAEPHAECRARRRQSRGRRSPRCTSATWTRWARPRGAHVLGNYSWTRALQGLMARYQAAVSARCLPAVDDPLSRAEPTH